MQISEVTKSDFELFWPVFKNVVYEQETYAFDPDIDFESAYNLWCLSPQKTYVVKENGLILGSDSLQFSGEHKWKRLIFVYNIQCLV